MLNKSTDYLSGSRAKSLLTKIPFFFYKCMFAECAHLMSVWNCIFSLCLMKMYLLRFTPMYSIYVLCLTFVNKILVQYSVKIKVVQKPECSSAHCCRNKLYSKQGDMLYECNSNNATFCIQFVQVIFLLRITVLWQSNIVTVRWWKRHFHYLRLQHNH